MLEPMVQRSELAKMDYAYTRYKSLCMATHTATTFVPAYHGCVGKIARNENEMRKFNKIPKKMKTLNDNDEALWIQNPDQSFSINPKYEEKKELENSSDSAKNSDIDDIMKDSENDNNDSDNDKEQNNDSLHKSFRRLSFVPTPNVNNTQKKRNHSINFTQKSIHRSNFKKIPENDECMEFENNSNRSNKVNDTMNQLNAWVDVFDNGGSAKKQSENNPKKRFSLTTTTTTPLRQQENIDPRNGASSMFGCQKNTGFNNNNNNNIMTPISKINNNGFHFGSAMSKFSSIKKKQQAPQQSPFIGSSINHRGKQKSVLRHTIKSCLPKQIKEVQVCDFKSWIAAFDALQFNIDTFITESNNLMKKCAGSGFVYTFLFFFFKKNKPKIKLQSEKQKKHTSKKKR